MTDYGPFTDKAGVQALIDAAIAGIPDGGGGGTSDPTALKIAANLADLADKAVARSNLNVDNAGTAATLATAAHDAAIAAAATDATTKANNAQSAAATDASTKADAAQAAAISAAATDATTKADNAQAAAIAAAATDATTKASNAQAAAISAAATAAAAADLAMIVDTSTSTSKVYSSSKVASLFASYGLHTTTDRYVEDFGAVGDGTTDDTAHIQAAIDDAVAFAAGSGKGEATVVFQDKPYALSSAPTKGGARAGNAILTLPIVLGVNRKIVLNLKGKGSQAPGYWLQTTPQTDGTALIATNNAPAPDGTWHEASILGGPAAGYNAGEGGNDIFNNMHVNIDGLEFFQPHNGGWVLVDLLKIASASIPKAKFNAYGSPAGSPSILAPTNGNDIGLRMPGQSNNDVSHVGDVSFSGLFYAASIGEHFVAERLGMIYCPYGLYISASGVPTHGAKIGYLGFEYGKTIVQAGLSSSAAYPLVIDLIDAEQMTGGGYVLDDSGNHLYGEISWAAFDATDPAINGAKNMQIKNYRRARGAMASPPTIPASGGSATLPYSPSGYWIGNVTNLTACTVDGISVNPVGPIFARGGAVVIPTYSSGGTWNWYSV